MAEPIGCAAGLISPGAWYRRPSNPPSLFLHDRTWNGWACSWGTGTGTGTGRGLAAEPDPGRGCSEQSASASCCRRRSGRLEAKETTRQRHGSLHVADPGRGRLGDPAAFLSESVPGLLGYYARERSEGGGGGVE